MSELIYKINAVLKSYDFVLKSSLQRSTKDGKEYSKPERKTKMRDARELTPFSRWTKEMKIVYLYMFL